MRNSSFVLVRMAFWLFVVAVALIGVFFIIHNACWLVADDAIVIRHTGWGKAFSFPFGVYPEAGRFFPFAYCPYNILLLFNDSLISPKAHYIVNAVGFLVYVMSAAVLAVRILKETKTLFRFFVSICFVTVCVELAFPMFILVRSTMWVGYTLMMVFALLTHCFFFDHRWAFGIGALLCINFFCYCGEFIFLFPLSMGACTLLFRKKQLEKREVVFSWLLIGSGLTYLVLYGILILPHIVNAYDGSHGGSLGIVENALKMIWGCKILILLIVILLVRVVDIVKNKKECMYYDVLLLMAAAGCCGSFILRLNLDNYYILSVLIGMPAVLYFSVYYFKEKLAIVFWVLLVLFYARSVGSEVKHNQRDRKETYRQITLLSAKIDESEGVFCYDPVVEGYSYDVEIRSCKYDIIDAYLGWLRHDPDFSIQRVPVFTPMNNTVWLSAMENRVLFPEDHQLELYGEEFYWAGWIDGYWVKTTE